MRDALIMAAPLSTPLRLPASGTQFLPVSGRITDRLLVSYRAPAAALAPLVPAPFGLDVREGQGFVSVCAVEIVEMGVVGTPSVLRFENREFLYRLAVRLGRESTFITLRSDVSSRALALLGRWFSHYRPRLAQVGVERTGRAFSMRCATRDGSGDAEIAADLSLPAPGAEVSSLFASAADASEFLLGMRFSADAVRGRVRVQPIDHDPWQPRFVPVSRARFAFLDRLAHGLGTAFTYDGTLAVRDVRQTWRAARWL